MKRHILKATTDAKNGKDYADMTIYDLIRGIDRPVTIIYN